MRLLAILTLLPLLAHATAPTTRPAVPYPTAHTAPLDATDKLLDATDTHTLHRVEFNGVRPGSRVPANLYVPKNAALKPPYPAVLLQYGSGGNKNTNYIVMIGKLAVARGFVVLTIDAPNRGERKHKDPRLSFLDANFLQYLGDYSRAADYLCARPDVDPKRLAYVGISWGAITGVTYAAHDPRIAAVASLVGGGNFANVIPGAVPEDLRKKTEAFDPYYNVQYIAPRPLLLINVTKDQLVPKFMAESLHKAAPAHAKKIWLDADHFFTGVDREKTCADVIDWVREALTPPPAK
ncbi:MAG TPA: alpha/beta fold hydrolase [Tepidisphaeraceae bacterium]|nr:alpha/beta fold hydrolase [Tepidisphaeraceae bacterium]